LWQRRLLPPLNQKRIAELVTAVAVLLDLGADAAQRGIGGESPEELEMALSRLMDTP
jgi:hypothetical protein